MDQKVVKPPRVEQLVLLVSSSIRKSQWPLGEAIKQIKGRNDVVRAVKIQTMSQGKLFEIERPLHVICLLEIHAPVKEEQ